MNRERGKTMSKIFEEGRIGNQTIKNRLIMSAMVTNYCTEDGKPTERFIQYHEARARGGVGLLTTEACYVTKAGRGFPHQAGLQQDENIEAWKAFTAHIHAAGAKCSAQLYHGGRQTSEAATGGPLEAPSDIPCPLMGGAPVPLTVERIHEIVREFGEAARRAKEAGFDAVEIHGAHGYLLSEFQSPYSNRRTDEYGGSVENRERFPLEVLRSVRAAVGPDFPILYKVSAEEGVAGGLTIEDTCAFAKKLVENGVSAIICSRAVYENVQYQIPPASEKLALNVENASKIKKAINSAVPVSVVGRMRGMDTMEEVLETGKADFINLARPLLCDPELPNKMKEGRLEEIRPCLSCNQGCVDYLLGGQPIKCMINPLTGRESDVDMTPVKAPKQVLVIGGGPGGMEAARVAAMRGHRVILCEQSGQLGGQMNDACLPPHKGEIKAYIDYQIRVLGELGVDIRYNTTMTAADVKAVSADEVILATGSNPIDLKIPGSDGENVVSAHQALHGAPVGNRVAVIGGGLVGCETAEYLFEQGKDVTIIEMKPDIASDMGLVNKMSMKSQYGHVDGFQAVTNSTLKSIQKDGVTVERDGKEEAITGIETVVMAVGSTPNNALEKELEAAGIAYHKVGDCVKAPRQILHAVHEAFDIAVSI